MSTSRGRRPGGPDTRGQILDAARESFAHKGFAGTTIRAVAGSAGVDPALVHHYFGSKEDLFLAALEIPADPRQVVPTLFEDGLDGAGERLIRLSLRIWEDPTARLPLIALVRTSLGSEGPADLLREAMLRMIFEPLEAALDAAGDPQSRERVQLVASQMIGVVVARYLLRLEPLASMTPDEIVGWVGPTLQRYLDGPVPAT